MALYRCMSGGGAKASFHGNGPFFSSAMIASDVFSRVYTTGSALTDGAKCLVAGTYKLKVAFYNGHTASATATLYKNGSATATTKTVAASTYVEDEFTVTLAVNDVIRWSQATSNVFTYISVIE